MSRERELLERIIAAWEDDRYELIDALYPLIDDARKLLESKEQDQAKQDEEPVAYLYDLDAYCDHRPEQDVLARKIPKGIPSEYLKNVRPLYLHPAQRPNFVRLSEEEVNSLTYAPYEPYELICAVENRLVEKNRG